MLVRFTRNYFYDVYYHDDQIDSPHVKLTRSGRKLIAQYYHEKYGTRISFHQNFIDFTLYLKKFLQEENDKVRHAFFIGDTGPHSMSIIYINDNGKKCFLCADSLGDQIGSVFENGTEIRTTGSSTIAARTISRVTAIPTYIVSAQSLADSYSCGVQSFVFARDGANPDLTFQQVTRRSTTTNKEYTETKLPDRLLKSSQISHFTTSHKEPENPVIHQHKHIPETLTQFQNRYKRNSKNDYLRIKGLKFADMIEIQFYINELKKIFLDKWTPELRSAFISQAKNELNKQWQITLNLKRPGLHGLALRFLNMGQHIVEKKLERTSFFTPPPQYNDLANRIIQLLNDKNYWQGKMFMGWGVDNGIQLMQEKLHELENKGISPEGKFNALRRIAGEELSKKSIFYLLTSFTIDTRHTMVQTLFSLFTQDLRMCQPAMDIITKDWEKFRRKRATNEAGPSHITAQRP